MSQTCQLLRAAAAAAAVTVGMAEFHPPRLLSCDFDLDWASYGATLDAQLRDEAPAIPKSLLGLPKVCAREDWALFNWSDDLAATSWPTGDAWDVFKKLQYSCDPDATGGIAEDCLSENGGTLCLYGVVSASACLATMYAVNGMKEDRRGLFPTALGAARGLQWLLRSGDKMLEFLDSSSWPFTVTDVVAIVSVWAPIVNQEIAKLMPLTLEVPNLWKHGESSWLSAEQAARQSLGLVAGWQWPPQSAEGTVVIRNPRDTDKQRRLVRIFAFGTHCSVMAEPVSAMSILLPTEFELQVTWRGTKEYCGYHSGKWPVVQSDKDSPMRQVFDEFSEKELGPIQFRRSHRDSLKTPASFQEALRRALAREGRAFSEADVAFCSEPAIACVTMYEAGKPLIGYFGVHIAFMLKDKQDQLSLYRRFRDELAQDPRSTFATVAPYISMQMLYHMPVEVPAVRPLSLYTLPAVYTAARPYEVLLNKRPIAFWDLSVMLDGFARVNGKPLDFVDASELFALGRHSFEDWAAFRAAVYWPYDWLQTMAFYDWVNMGLPTFVPDLPLYTFSRGTNAMDEWQATTWHVPRSLYPHHYSDWDDLSGRVYWWLMTDFCALPGVRQFDSIAQLFTELSSQQGLWKMSGQLREAQVGRVASTTLFWRSALLRALGTLTT